MRGSAPQLSRLAEMGVKSRSRTRERTALRTAAQLESNSNKARPVVTVGLLAVSIQIVGYIHYIVQ
jgi:ribosomal protein L18